VATCYFCEGERMLIPGCTKRRFGVCETHSAMICPKCGQLALWMEHTDGTKYYLCMDDQCDYRHEVVTIGMEE